MEHYKPAEGVCSEVHCVSVNLSRGRILSALLLIVCDANHFFELSIVQLSSCSTGSLSQPALKQWTNHITMEEGDDTYLH